MSRMPEPGAPAPPFDLPTAGGGRIGLDALKGRAVVLYFYPKDDTSACTQEALSFTQFADAFDKSGAKVLGVSRDSVKSHDAFIAKHALAIDLASDPEGGACDAYGVWVEKSMYGKKYMGIQRATFLIDREGRIARVWPKVKVAGHAEEVLAAVRTLA
jgi:peroxiredoxin Q/BCP